MDELQTRLDALQLLMHEHLSRDPLGILSQLTAALEMGSFDDERDERVKAIAVLEDTITRFEASGLRPGLAKYDES